MFLDDIQLSYLGVDYMIRAICLDLFTISLNFLCKPVLDYFFIPLSHFVPTKQDPVVQKRDTALPG